MYAWRMNSGAFALLLLTKFEFVFVNFLFFVGLTAIKTIIKNNTMIIQNISDAYFQCLYRTKTRMREDG